MTKAQERELRREGREAEIALSTLQGITPESCADPCQRAAAVRDIVQKKLLKIFPSGLHLQVEMTVQGWSGITQLQRRQRWELGVPGKLVCKVDGGKGLKKSFVERKHGFDIGELTESIRVLNVKALARRAVIVEGNGRELLALNLTKKLHEDGLGFLKVASQRRSKDNYEVTVLVEGIDQAEKLARQIGTKFEAVSVETGDEGQQTK